MSTIVEPTDGKGASYQAGLLGGFTLIAAALLVVGNIATRDAIEQRRAEDLLAFLGQVIPSAIHDNDLLENPLDLPLASGETLTVYRARKGPEITAVAYPLGAQGYGGTIDLILGVSASGEILGVRALAHAETPGLGDKIDVSRDDWIRGFDGLSLGNPPAKHWAVKKDGGDFDQFSGATITPRAVVGAIKEGLELFRDNRPALLASAVVRETPIDGVRTDRRPEDPHGGERP
jgi:Na+-translocating ferredoxin:NAD+ oxidoreductase subunit G